MLEELYATDRKWYGYILIAGETYYVYKSNTVEHKLLDNLSVKRQKHQKKGGQSAPRIERERQRKEYAYVKAVCNSMNKHFTTAGQCNIDGIIVAGPGEMKYKVLDCSELHPELKKRVLKIQTCAEISEDYLKDLVDQSLEWLGDEELQQERELFTQLQDMIHSCTDRVLFGKEIPAAVKDCLVERIYISSKKQEELQLVENNGCAIHVFNSNLLNDYGGVVGVTWY